MAKKSSFKSPFRSDEKPNKNKEALEAIRGKPKEEPQKTGASGSSTTANFNDANKGAIQVNPQGQEQTSYAAPPQQGNNGIYQNPTYAAATNQVKNSIESEKNKPSIASQFVNGAMFNPTEIPNSNPMYPGEQDVTLASAAGMLVGVQGVGAYGATLRSARTLLRGEQILAKAPKIGTVATSTTAKNTAELIAHNTKTERLAKSWIQKNILTSKETISTVNAITGVESISVITKTKQTIPLTMLIGAAYASLATYGMSTWLGKNEGQQPLGMASYLAFKDGDYETAIKMTEASDEMLADDSFFEKIMKAVPGFGIADTTLNEAVPASLMYNEVVRKLSQDKIAQEQTGMTDAQIYAERKAEQKAEETILTQTQLETSQQIQELKNEALALNREEDAKYWNDQLEKKAEYEEQQRKANLDYWQTYFKMWMDSRAATSNSKLSFGLL